MSDSQSQNKSQDLTQVPGYLHVFILADEIDPFRQKIIRRVIVDPEIARKMADDLGRSIRVHPGPEKLGFSGHDLNSNVKIWRHVSGMNNSIYISASSLRPRGADRFVGEPFWIDAARVRASGGKIYTTEDILKELEITKLKLSDPSSLAKIEKAMLDVKRDSEYLIERRVEPSAIKSIELMRATRAMQVVQFLSFVITAVDLGVATKESYKTHSIRPLAHETARQFGGWLGAWSGMQTGILAGAAVGIETGPGALISATVGGVIGGAAGYFAATKVVGEN